MAQVTRNVQVDIDRLLVFLAGEYEWAVESSADWEEDEFASFAEEQPLRDEALDELAAYAELGRLSVEQQLVFDDLVRYIHQHQSLIERLLIS